MSSPRCLGTDRVLARLERDDARLDVEVAAELLPDDVHVAAEDQVGTRGGQPRGFAALPPLPFQRQRAQHDRLGGALGPGTGGLSGSVEQIRDDPDASLLDLGGPGILRVIDEVAVQVHRDQPLRLGLHPGGHERRQIAGRVSLDGQVLRHQAEGVARRHAVGRELAARNLLRDEAIAEQGRCRGLVHCQFSFGLTWRAAPTR
jgi:hypothetical protein